MVPDTRICIIVDAINDNAELRGPDRYLINLLSEMWDLAPQARFILTHAPWQEAIAAMKVPSNVELMELSCPRGKLARALWHAFVFPRWADRQKADAVFLPNIILTFGMQTPSVMTVHDLAHFRFPEKFGYLKGYIQRIQVRLAMISPDYLIAVSAFTQSDMKKFLNISGSRVVHVEEGGPKPVKRPKPAVKPPFFLYVGRIERSKNIEGLIDAFLASDILDVMDARLVIVGSPGNAQAAVQNHLKGIRSGRIDFMGFVSESELNDLYLECTGFTFPSLAEGFGLVLLEAMAHGAPIIAMRATAVPEVVGKAGLLIDPAKEDGLRYALEKLASDEELQNDLRQRGYNRLNDFSWKRAAEQTFSLLQEVIR